MQFSSTSSFLIVFLINLITFSSISHHVSHQPHHISSFSHHISHPTALVDEKHDEKLMRLMRNIASKGNKRHRNGNVFLTFMPPKVSEKRAEQLRQAARRQYKKYADSFIYMSICYSFYSGKGLASTRKIAIEQLLLVH